MEWYYANRGQRVGPVTPVAFEALVRDGGVSDDTLVWAQGMSDWQPWSAVAPTTGVCATTGGRFWQRDLNLSEGNLVHRGEQSAMPGSGRGSAVRTEAMSYAGFWVRFLAKVLDGLLLWIPNTLISFGLAFVFFGKFLYAPQMNEFELGLWLGYQGTMLLASISLVAVYQWFFLSRYGATPGKMALGLKVVRSDGSALSGRRAIGRALAEQLSNLTLLIGYIIAAFDDQKRSLHDRICDTRVIKAG